MIVLGIESATQRAGVALGGAEGVIAECQITHGRRHAETLMPSIDHILKASTFIIDEVSVVAVDVGPGLYTGMRVGIATAKALALGLGVPMLSFSSLDLLAFPVRFSDRLICTAIDARRGELYWAFYRRVQGGVQRLGEYHLGTPEQLSADLHATGEPTLAVGDGILRYSELFERLENVELGTVGQAYPTPASLVELAHPKAIREEFIQTWEVVPMYLRDADAVPNWEQRS